MAIKQSIQQGREGIPKAITGLDLAIDALYPHTVLQDESQVISEQTGGDHQAQARRKTSSACGEVVTCYLRIFLALTRGLFYFFAVNNSVSRVLTIYVRPLFRARSDKFQTVRTAFNLPRRPHVDVRCNSLGAITQTSLANVLLVQSLQPMVVQQPSYKGKRWSGLPKRFMKLD